MQSSTMADEKGFNINLDFDIDSSLTGRQLQQQPKKTGVDIDLMITISTTNSRMETRENSYEVSHPLVQQHQHHHANQQLPADVEYWRMTNSGPSKKSLDPNLIENEMSWTTLNGSNSQNNNNQQVPVSSNNPDSFNPGF